MVTVVYNSAEFFRDLATGSKSGYFTRSRDRNSTSKLGRGQELLRTPGLLRMSGEDTGGRVVAWPEGDTKPPQLANVLTEANAKKFLKAYAEYVRHVKLANKTETVQRRAITMLELVPLSQQRVIRAVCRFGQELTNESLKEGLQHIARVATDSDVDVRVILTKLLHVLKMGKESSAYDRVIQIMARWEEFVIENAIESEVRSRTGKYKPGIGKIVSKAILDGLWPDAFADEARVAIATEEDAIKADPARLFTILLDLADAWRVVERMIKFEKQSQRDRGQKSHKSERGKSDNKNKHRSGKGEALQDGDQSQRGDRELQSSHRQGRRKESGFRFSCDNCGEIGHKWRQCPKPYQKPASSTAQGQPSRLLQLEDPAAASTVQASQARKPQLQGTGMSGRTQVTSGRAVATTVTSPPAEQHAEGSEPLRWDRLPTTSTDLAPPEPEGEPPVTSWKWVEPGKRAVPLSEEGVDVEILEFHCFADLQVAGSDNNWYFLL